MIGNNHKKIFYRKTANNTAIIINAKSLSSMRKNIFLILLRILIQNIINEKNQK